MALSDRPGSAEMYWDHFVPCVGNISLITALSSMVQALLFVSGSRWLTYLSLHCLPVRESMDKEMSGLQNRNCSQFVEVWKVISTWDQFHVHSHTKRRLFREREQAVEGQRPPQHSKVFWLYFVLPCVQYLRPWKQRRRWPVCQLNQLMTSPAPM